jgi:hypothetical protein
MLVEVGSSPQDEVDDLFEPSAFESWPCNFLMVALPGLCADLLPSDTRDVLDVESGWTVLVVFFFDQSRHNCLYSS